MCGIDEQFIIGFCRGIYPKFSHRYSKFEDFLTDVVAVVSYNVQATLVNVVEMADENSIPRNSCHDFCFNVLCKSLSNEVGEFDLCRNYPVTGSPYCEEHKSKDMFCKPS